MKLKQRSDIKKSSAMIMRFFSLTLLSSMVVACSSSNPQSDYLELLPADSIKQGPGFFTGDSGSFSAIGEKKPKGAVAIKPNSPSVTLENKDLQQTSEILEEKIRQSQRNTIELELLKRQVDQKLRTQ